MIKSILWQAQTVYTETRDYVQIRKAVDVPCLFFVLSHYEPLNPNMLTRVYNETRHKNINN